MGMSVSTPSPMMVVTHTLSFIRPLSVHVSRSSRLREMQRNSQFAIRAIRNSAKCSGNLAGNCPLKLLFGWLSGTRLGLRLVRLPSGFRHGEQVWQGLTLQRKE